MVITPAPLLGSKSRIMVITLAPLLGSKSRIMVITLAHLCRVHLVIMVITTAALLWSKSWHYSSHASASTGMQISNYGNHIRPITVE
jgi:hypothetical protein